MVKKTREEALLTRNAILDAAEIVFHEHGVGKASLAEIAAAAGVTRGAVYWHFTNKIDLFDAVVQRVFGLMEAKQDELQKTRQYDDPVDMIRELALYFIDRVANDPHYYRIIAISWHKSEYVGEIAEIRDKHQERGNHFLGVGVAAFRASKKLGFLSPHVDPHTAAIGMMALVDGLIINWTLGRPAFSLTDVGVKIIDSYLSGLRVVKD
ncbi:MAG: TetR family transcriptional regulator [Candidatus Accumulibacter sp.]|jgi:TetR/AcrR family acrAB operon transcriptional repressor|nr:TetR family transcriptional regulator [Accumulibacter sp.]